MKLYHYNANAFDTLLTKRQQGIVSDNEQENATKASKFRGDPGPYTEHVSFLLGPAPVEFMGSIFPEDHHTWRTGNILVEHAVSIENLDLYAWRIVEGPVSMFFLDHVPWFNNRWYKKVWFGTREKTRKLFKESGTDLDSLKRALSRLDPDITREAYARLPKRKDYEEAKDKYAASVPHLMIYTHSPITVDSHNTVVVNDGVVPGLEDIKQYPKAIAAKGYNNLYVIPGYSNYLATPKGEIYNKRTKNKTKGSSEGRYLKVYIRDKPSDKPSLRYTHDLICRAFHGLPPKPNMVVGHKDGNKENILPSNLEWQTQKENVDHAYQTGLKASAKWK